MTATAIYLHAKRKPKAAVSLSHLPDGADFLVLFAEHLQRLRTVNRRFLVERSNEKYARIDELTLRGRSLEVTTAAGHFGEDGELVDVATHSSAGKFTSNLSTAVETHGLLLVPTGSPFALLYIERARSANGLTKALGLFVEEFGTRYDELKLKTESVVESEAWIEMASLQKVKVSSHRTAKDSTDGVEHVDAGEVTHVLKPTRSGDSLPKDLWDRLKGNRLAANQLLGISEDHEVDRIDVTLQGTAHSQTKTKTFEVNNAGAPAFGLLLTDHNDKAPTMSTFRDRALDEAADHFDLLDVEWSEQDASGRWPDDEDPLSGGANDAGEVERPAGSH